MTHTLKVELEPTRLTECTLLVAIPTSLAAVEAALEGGAYADYVGRSGDAETVWTQNFRDGAQAALSVIAHARDLGVTVVENPTGADWACAFSFRTVTVVAHWRGPALSPHDIRIEAAEIVDRIQHDPSETAQRLRAGLSTDWYHPIMRESGEDDRRSRLAELLDLQLRRGPSLVVERAGLPIHTDAVTRHHLNRDAIEAWWPGVFTPGNCLELADGLHAPTTLAACVPPSWSGVVDLSNCRSSQLASVIKQRRHDRLVISNDNDVHPFKRLHMLDMLYTILNDQPAHYADVRLRLAALLLEEAAPRDWRTATRDWLRRHGMFFKGGYRA